MSSNSEKTDEHAATIARTEAQTNHARNSRLRALGRKNPAIAGVLTAHHARGVAFADLQANHAALVEQQNKLAREAANTVKENLALGEDHAALQKEYATRSLELEQCVKEKLALMEKLAAAEQDIATARNDIETVDAEVTGLRAELASVKEQLVAALKPKKA